MVAEGVIKASTAPPPEDGKEAEGEDLATHGAGRDAHLHVDGPAFYADLARDRVEYGPAFRVLEELSAAGDAALLRQAPPAPRPDPENPGAHP